MATNNNSEWVNSGDRSHPNLKLIDEVLRHQSTYPGHENDLQKLESLHFDGDKFSFNQTLHRIRESQNIYTGNRSHSRIVKLDALQETLTYDGWDKDCKKAEKEHVNNRNGYCFNIMIEGMERKQAMYVGNRIHTHLRFLDSLHLTYQGWKNDMKSALETHEQGYTIRYEKYLLTEKQRMFEGIRTHRRLVALDSLKLTYPGWKYDIKVVEEEHLGLSFWHLDGVDKNYDALLERLKRKQREFATGVEDMSSMNPIQRKIVETHWTYPRHEDDVEEAKKNYHISLFSHGLAKCELKQMMHENDFGHHPALIKLVEARQVLSYPGCKTDIKRAKAHLSRDGYTLYKKCFDEMIQGMENKQNVYDGLERKLSTESLDGTASKFPTKAPNGVTGKVPAEALDGTVSEAPAQTAGRLGSMRRFLPRSNSIVPRRMRRKKAKPSEWQVGCCSICLDAPPTHVFVPCGHMCACQSCSQELMKSSLACPMCTQTATMVMEVFLP